MVIKVNKDRALACRLRILCRTARQTHILIQRHSLLSHFVAVAKAAFNKKKNLFTSKLDFNLRKKLVKCYVWSMALYGAETWTLRATDQKRLESFEMWFWRRMEKISWTDHVRNEEVLLRVNEQSRGISYMKYKNGRLTGLVTSYIETAFYNKLLKER